MTKRGFILLVVIAVVLIGGALVAYLWRKPTGSPTTNPESREAISSSLPGPTPLPEHFEASGLVSQRVGSLRLYVAVTKENSILKPGAQTLEPERLDKVPIVVIVENETYRAIDLRKDVTSDADLFAVVVSRTEGGDRKEVFVERKPSAGISGWEPAERMSFTIDWPIGDAVAGKYLVSVTPAFGNRSPLQIFTILK